MSHRRVGGGRLLGRAVATCAFTLLAAAGIPSAAVAKQELDQWWLPTWQMSQVSEVTDGSGVTVAVIDTGVDASISELAGAVVSGVDLTGEGGDGTVDYGDPGHGTGMATLIAARGGASGMMGIAPGATILPIATGDELVGVDSLTAVDRDSEGIRQAVDRGAQVINMSIGSVTPTPDVCPEPVAAAVRYAVDNDVVVVAASGNTAGPPTEFPGSCPGVVTAGAVDRNAEPWVDSHRSEYVDVAAPGVETSAVLRGGVIGSGDGTSSSTALVSGVLALIRAEFPDASAREVVARLLATVQDLEEPGRDDATGYGMVRPYEALTAQVPPDAPNPIFDELGDLTAPGESPGVAPPQGVEPVLVDDEESNAAAVFAVLGAVGLVLAAVVVVVVLLVVRASRRRRPSYPAGYPPAPPHYPPVQYGPRGPAAPGQPPGPPPPPLPR
jgi:type VII secretion-associated serine protease mycosin